MDPEWTYWDDGKDPFKLHLDDGVDDGAYLINIQAVSPRYGLDIYVGYGKDPARRPWKWQSLSRTPSRTSPLPAGS